MRRGHAAASSSVQGAISNEDAGGQFADRIALQELLMLLIVGLACRCCMIVEQHHAASTESTE